MKFGLSFFKNDIDLIDLETGEVLAEGAVATVNYLKNFEEFTLQII